MTVQLFITKDYKKESLSELSKKIATESGEEWVDQERIEEHNQALKVETPSMIQKIWWFGAVDKPYVMSILCIAVPAFILALINIAYAFLGILLGAILCFVLFRANANLCCGHCKSKNSYKEIFTYVFSRDQYSEYELNPNGRIGQVQTLNERTFAICECEKCKARKVEIYIRSRERR